MIYTKCLSLPAEHSSPLVASELIWFAGGGLAIRGARLAPAVQPPPTQPSFPEVIRSQPWYRRLEQSPNIETSGAALLGVVVASRSMFSALGVVHESVRILPDPPGLVFPYGEYAVSSCCGVFLC